MHRYHSHGNAMAEVNHRASVLSQRKNDRIFRVKVNMFTQPMAKFHAGDLFYIESKVMDLTKHDRLLCPSLTSHFRSSSSRCSDRG